MLASIWGGLFCYRQASSSCITIIIKICRDVVSILPEAYGYRGLSMWSIVTWNVRHVMSYNHCGFWYSLSVALGGTPQTFVLWAELAIRIMCMYVLCLLWQLVASFSVMQPARLDEYQNTCTVTLWQLTPVYLSRNCPCGFAMDISNWDVV